MSPHDSRTTSTRARLSRSRDRRVGKRVMSANMPPPPPRHSRAASTLSSTESQPKVCTRWKVRRRPRRARVTADDRVASTPPSQTRPSFGLRNPEMTSKRVVLPAPFGPIKPHTSPCSTTSSTPCSALIPPKRTPMFSSTRDAHEASPTPGGSFPDRARALGTSVTSGPPTKTTSAMQSARRSDLPIAPPDEAKVSAVSTALSSA